MAIERIVVLTDFSTHSDRAVELALEMARALGARLQVLHCFPEVPGGRAPLGSVGVDPKLHDDAVGRMKKQVAGFDAKGVSIDYDAHPGIDPAACALDVLKKSPPDLIVLGTHGHGGLMHLLLGSTAEQIVRKAPCPVVVARAD